MIKRKQADIHRLNNFRDLLIDAQESINSFVLSLMSWIWQK